MPPASYRPFVMPGAVTRLAVVLGVGILAVAGCSKAPPSQGPKAVPPTPIARLNTGAMTLARVDFCSLLPDPAVRTALDGGIGDHSSWRNGDRTQVDTGTEDVVHEYGCSWSRGSNAASAWIYARPINSTFARAVLDKTAHRPGCKADAGPEFGSPHQRQTCTMPDGSTRVRISGLFRSTYLTCEVQGPSTDALAQLDQRAAAWCVQVANATNITH